MSSTRILVLTILLLAVAVRSHAQSYPINRCTWLLGGSASFHGARDIGNNSRAFVIDVSPRLGYFVRPHLAINANLQFGRVTYDLGHSYEWGVGPGLTYYFGTPKHRIFPYLAARTLFSWATSQGNDPQASPYRTWNASWLLGAGAVAMIVKNVGVTGELFYQHDHFGVELNRQESTNNGEEYGLQFGVAIFVF